MVETIPFCEYVFVIPLWHSLRRYIVRFLPSWLPGTGFKRWAEEWAKKTVKHRQAPFDGVLKKMASCHVSEVDEL
jgi:hypothetical protein